MHISINNIDRNAFDNVTIADVTVDGREFLGVQFETRHGAMALAAGDGCDTTNEVLDLVADADGEEVLDAAVKAAAL